MNFGEFVLLRLCYQSKTMTVEEKIEETRKMFPQLTVIYVDDLKTLFSEPLPFIEAVEITTKYGDNTRSYVQIIKMPEKISADVQKALMRIGGCLGGFELDKWGIGSMTDAMNRHMSEYAKAHPGLKGISGKNAGYPMVYEVSREEVDSASNECFKVSELVGIVLS